MNKRDFIASIHSEMQGKSLEAYRVGMTALVAFVAQDERVGALHNLREALSRMAPKEMPALDGKTFLEDARKLLERSEEGEFEFKYEYEPGAYWDGDNDYYLVDCSSLTKELEPLLDKALACIRDEQFEVGLAALDMLTAVAGYAEGDVINYQTLIEHDLLQGEAETIHMSYARAALMVLRKSARADKLLQIAYLAGHELPIGKIIQSIDSREIDLDAFLEEWPQAIMREIELSEALRPGMYHVKFLETMLTAIVWLQGDARAAEYVHTYGRTHPILYCALIESMTSNGNYVGAIETADTALSVVDSKQYRTTLADLQYDAGEASHEVLTMGSAALQGFAASLSLKHFLRLRQYGDDAAQSQAIALFRASMDRCHDVVPILFVMGAYKELWNMVRADKEPLGWSTSKKGAAFPLFVALLAGNHPLQGCVRRGIERKMYDEEEKAGFIEMVNSTSKVLPPDDGKLYYEWCVNEIENRVEAIVRNQHRGSYGKAALLIMSMAETLSATEGPGAARRYISAYQAKYPRHRAFLAEINELEEVFCS